MSQHPPPTSGPPPRWQSPQFQQPRGGRQWAPWPGQTPWPRQAPWPGAQRTAQASGPTTQRLQRLPYGQPTAWQTPPQRPRRRRSGLGSVLTMVLLVWGVLTVASTVRDWVQQVPPASQTGGSTTTTTGDAGTYSNESYQPPAADTNPPPVPGPRTLDAAESLVTSNPVYDQDVPTPTNCPLGTVDMRSASRNAMQSHLNDQMACLMRVFDDPVTAAGFEMPRPPVTVYDQPIRTACGDFDDVNAAYCTADQRIYYAQPLLRAFPAQVANTRYAAEMIIAHEFGHAVQARTAMLVSEKVLEEQARTEASALELSRRTEVQADCLAGLYVASVAQSQELGENDLTALGNLAYNLGDDVLSGQLDYAAGHGTGNARRDWFTRGLGSPSIGVCNSFVADSDEVR